MRSSQGRRRGKKKTEFVRAHPCASHVSVSFKKKKLPISDLDCHACAGAMQQYPESQQLCTELCSSVQKKKLRHPCAGAIATVSSGSDSSIRSSYLRTTLEGTIVSPLVNTTSGLSGGRCGGDVPGAAPAPTLVVARLLARALALDLACGIRCPPFFIRKAYASDGSSTPRRKSSAMR